jgi:hypothetical protein
LGPDFFPAQAGLGQRAIQSQPRPIDFPQCRRIGQALHPELLEYAGIHSFWKRRRAELLKQMSVPFKAFH